MTPYNQTMNDPAVQRDDNAGLSSVPGIRNQKRKRSHDLQQQQLRVYRDEANKKHTKTVAYDLARTADSIAHQFRHMDQHTFDGLTLQAQEALDARAFAEWYDGEEEVNEKEALETPGPLKKIAPRRVSERVSYHAVDLTTMQHPSYGRENYSGTLFNATR
jgi:hypothetical protein|eukprot:COSAG06_NODE_19629_length_830_cov_0.830369_1_plen_161_part_00